MMFTISSFVLCNGPCLEFCRTRVDRPTHNEWDNNRSDIYTYRKSAECFLLIDLQRSRDITKIRARILYKTSID